MALRSVGAALRLVDRVLPPVAESLAADLFLTPRKAAAPGRELAWRASASRETRTVAGFPITVWSWGSGTPVLLLHGWEGRGTQLGAIATELASRGFRAIAPDLPAHGDSAGRRTNLLEFAAVIGALVDERPAAVVAHSFGCAGTMVALRERSYDGRIVFVSPPEDFAFFTHTFGGMLGITPDLATRMQHRLERRFSVDWSKLRGAKLAPSMTAPLLVVHDEDDTDVPHHFGRTIAAAWPGARLRTTQGLGHRRILREASVVEEIAGFLGARCDPTGRSS